jgi:hypothetical protein
MSGPDHRERELAEQIINGDAVNDVGIDRDMFNLQQQTAKATSKRNLQAEAKPSFFGAHN